MKCFEMCEIFLMFKNVWNLCEICEMFKIVLNVSKCTKITITIFKNNFILYARHLKKRECIRTTITDNNHVLLLLKKREWMR